MPNRDCPTRRLSLTDLMILVAGAAFSFWLAPEGLAYGMRRMVEIVSESRSVYLATVWSDAILTRTQPILAAWSLTVLVLALRRGESRRRLARQPGFVACAAAVLVLILVAPMAYGRGPSLVAGLPASVRWKVHLQYAFGPINAECGLAVAAAWLTLVLGGRWRPRPDWIDRFGRGVGIVWLLLIPIRWLEVFLKP